jgi:hypothetical protein
MRRLFIAIASAALLSVVSSPAVAAASSMSGEVFAGTPSYPQTSVTTCDATTIAVHFGSINQPATGPYPGFYSETGNLVVTSGVITGWSASWSVAAIASGTPYVSGTKTLQTAGGGVVVCAATGASTTTALTATLAYSANADAGALPAGITAFVGPDAGTATISLAFDTTAKTGTFTETFGVTAPPTGCDMARHHHDNDQCEDADHDHDRSEHHRPGVR